MPSQKVPAHVMKERSVECVGTAFIEPQSFAIEFGFTAAIVADDDCGRKRAFRASSEIGFDIQLKTYFEYCDFFVEAARTWREFYALRFD